jgi:hypothetical protein
MSGGFLLMQFNGRAKDYLATDGEVPNRDAGGRDSVEAGVSQGQSASRRISKGIVELVALKKTGWLKRSKKEKGDQYAKTDVIPLYFARRCRRIS